MRYKVFSISLDLSANKSWWVRPVDTFAIDIVTLSSRTPPEFDIMDTRFVIKPTHRADNGLLYSRWSARGIGKRYVMVDAYVLPETHAMFNLDIVCDLDKSTWVKSLNILGIVSKYFPSAMEIERNKI